MEEGKDSIEENGIRKEVDRRELKKKRSRQKKGEREGGFVKKRGRRKGRRCRGRGEGSSWLSLPP